MMEQEVPCRPVPAPRKLYPDVPKTEYENVTIDLINKNLNINSENIHDNTNCTDKVPNNKVFLGTLADDEATKQKTATTATITITSTGTGNGNGTGIGIGTGTGTGTGTTIMNTTKCILTETNDLYGPDANENLPAIIDSAPVPAPRPRKAYNNNSSGDGTEELLYENAQQLTNDNDTIEFVNNEPTTSTSTKSKSKSKLISNILEATTTTTTEAATTTTTSVTSTSSPTQTLNGVMRRAPDVPPKTYINYERERERERERKERAQRHSISSEFSTTSSCNIIGGSYDLNENHFQNTKTSKSASNCTLNSSIADSTGSSENTKYKSPSPGYVESESFESNETVEMLFDGIHTAPSDTNIDIDSDSNSSLTDITDDLLTCNDSDTDSDDNDILKSLGTTSKLLTESIGERVALKAKGAKQKLDKNLKTSTEILSSFGSETTNRLKNVKQRLGTNFTLTKKDKDKNKVIGIDPDRPQTLPPNDKVFNTISFSSPLQRKACAVVDLTVNESETEGSYEVPRSNKIVNCEMNLKTAPPSYEDALKSSSSPQNSFQRNKVVSKSLMTSKQLAKEASLVVLSKPQSSQHLNKVNEDVLIEEHNTEIMLLTSTSTSTPLPTTPPPPPPSLSSSSLASTTHRRSLVDAPSPPMPSYPPPILTTDEYDAKSTEAIYGKLNSIKAPTRLKRRKNYEHIELRRPIITNKTTKSTDELATPISPISSISPVSPVSPFLSGNSLRPNVDSAELHKLNLDAATAEREESLLIRTRNNTAEKNTPKPDRSESWEYFEENGNEEESGECSSPEPLYANQEATYGRVFEMATSNKDLLPPQQNLQNTLLVSISEEHTIDDLNAGAVGGCAINELPKVIQEFDPLKSIRSSTICHSDKSNQLLLLEHLLEEDAYGIISTTKSDDDISVCTSEEDNNVGPTKCTNNQINKPTTPTTPTTPTIPTTPTTPTTPITPTTTATTTKIKTTQKLNTQTVVLLSPNRNSTKSTPTTPTTASNQMQIVHQNAQLLSDSMENMLDDTDEETKIKSYLSRTDEKPCSSEPVDLSRSSHNRTNWFIKDKKNINHANDTTTNRLNPFNKLNIDDGESPPSYLEAIGIEGKSSSSSSSASTSTSTSNLATSNEQKSRTARFMNTMNVFSNVKIRVDALKRKTSFKAAQKNSEVKVTLQMVPKPTLSPLLVRYEGPLIRFPSGVVEDILKEMQNRKATLRDRQFQTFLDQDMKTPKEIIPLEYITTLQCVSNNRVTDNSTHFYCFEITTSMQKNSGSGSNSTNIQTMSNPNLVITSGTSGNCKQQRVCHLYGVGKESERGVWMQKILESLTNVLPPKYTCHYYRAGWCYMKHSITSEWSGTWLVLKKSQRRLIFVSEATMNVEKMDLRKARCIVLKDSDETIKNLHVEFGPTLMIDCPPFTVYMIMSSPRETKIWRHIIREVAHNNGFSLSDQQLTKFSVPVIVDKCINFVYIHGSMSEGIYRKSGSENSILKLMAAFRADAFNVEITRNEYNEHDVANVLKRFMRDLPERLMGKLSDSFICVTDLNQMVDKLAAYKELLARLSVIERETLKKIVGHLAFISSQKSKNKMSVQNLTMIWGPTLLQNHQTETEMVYSQKEADVLTDLIILYKNLFPLTPDEMKKEQEMLNCLQKYYAAAETLTDSVKKSGDLKMWITVNPNPENVTEEKTQINVTISPTKTAYEICKELAPKMKMSTHQISLHEVILNENLERPLHHETKVFDVVLSWSYWPEDDRKNNYLVVKPIEFLREIQRAVKNLAIVTPSKELKFVDNRTKSFKSYQCELRDGKIVVSKKDKNDKTTIVREMFLQSTTAYLGCEKKRDFPWSWAITFVERTKTQILRSRDSPFIGHVLAGSEWVDRTIWFSSIWYCLYGDNILPPPEIILK